jgi:hypothetical protein
MLKNTLKYTIHHEIKFSWKLYGAVIIEHQVTINYLLNDLSQKIQNMLQNVAAIFR